MSAAGGLADLLALAAEVEQAAQAAVDGLRGRGYSWTEIGRRLGLTRQAAQQRWGPVIEEAPTTPACLWGTSGYCGQLRDHRRCWSSIQTPATLGTYGHRDDGHRWVCQCHCHEHQGYPPCPGDYDQAHDAETSSAQASVQLNLF